jgi:hypothetical protein
MSSHQAEIERAVLLGRRALRARVVDGPDQLTRLLHRRWFLGLAPGGAAGPRPPGPGAPHRVPAPGVPAARSATDSWRTWGRHWSEGRSCRGQDLVRLFLACAPHTSLHAVSAVVAHARDWDAPWLLSSRALQQAVPRPDATVLYLPVDAVAELRDPLGRMLDQLDPFLASTVPALTLRVGRGASLGQNPADGRPFGAHRCSVIAAAVHAHRDAAPAELYRRTLAALRAEGIDPHAPYRALGSTWEWPRPGARRTVAA